MMRLIAKELRQLAPIGGLWLVVLALGYGIQLFTERVDEQTFSSWCEGYCDYNSNVGVALFAVLFAMVTAYSLFPREHDDATIDFLRALPVSRLSVFVAKVLAAWILLSSITLLAYSIDAATLTSNPESIGGTFYPQVWATLLWRDCLFAFIILAHGVFLSWFRTLGLMIYAIYLVFLLWAESSLGSSGHWSIFSLLANEYSGSTLLVNSTGLAIHTVAAVVFLMVAYRLWSHTEADVKAASSGRAQKVLQVFFSVLAFVSLGAILSQQVSVGTGGAAEQNLKVVATDHYRFVYEESRSDVVNYIVEHAEADLDTLSRMLGIEHKPQIRVDLSSSNEHAAGLAKWKKILMDLDAFSDDLTQRRVLSHETTHVYQAIESNRVMSDYYSAAKFFIEGMAQYTSFEVIPELERRQSNWELASVAWHRQSIEFNDLINEAWFVDKFDAELHYSLGDLWTVAMVETCGVSSLGDFLRAVGRSGAERSMPAAIFWRDTTREIGCDLDTINVAWASHMRQLHEAVDIRAYPQFSNIAIRKDSDTNQLKITATLAGFAGAQLNDEVSAVSDQKAAASPEFIMPEKFILRLGSATTQLSGGTDPVFRGKVTEEGKSDVEFTVPEHALSGSRFRYQLGFSPSQDARYYYEPWRRGTVPVSASQP